MEVIKSSNIAYILTLLLAAFNSHAVIYNFPGAFPALGGVQGAMAANDVFNINSGTFTQGLSSALFSVSLNSGAQLNILQTTTLTYTGTNQVASTVYLNNNMANPTGITINGNLNAGNAKFAFFSEKTVAGPSQFTFSLGTVGAVNGDVYLNMTTNPILNIDAQSSLNGNVFFEQNPADITIGQAVAHKGYNTQGNITGINTLTVNNGIMQNNNILTFNATGSKSMTVPANGIFINNGSIANLSTLDVTGALQLNTNITATTRIKNAVAIATAVIQTNNPVVATTPIFDIQSGKYVSNFNGLNAFGQLTLPNTNFASLNASTFMFNRQSGYLPGGVHVLVAGNNPPVMPGNITASANNDIFISSLAVTADNNNIILTVQRKTFDQFANSSFNAEVAKILENIGVNNPSASAVNVLDWFESSTSSADLNNKLNVFKMLLSLPMPSLQNQYKIFSTVSNRLASIREKNSYLAGEDYFINEFWFRMSSINASQKSYDNVMPYKSSSYNVVFGIDSAVTNTDRLGIALSMATADVKSDVSSYSSFIASNNTRVFSFQATPYYLREFPSGYFVNLIAGATFNLYKTKTAYKNGSIFTPNINSTRSDVLFSLQSTLGSSFIMMNYLHVTVSGALNGSYAMRSPFNDQTIPGLELQVNPNSGGYITVSPRIEFSFPWQYTEIVFYPKIYVQYFYDLYGGSHDVSAKFLNYDQSFATSIVQRKSRAIIGAAFDFDLNEEFSLDFNYDYEFNPEFTSKQFTFTIKYRF